MRPAGTAVFAAHAADGGGVVMDCIHEFDYLQALLGPMRLTGSDVRSIGPDGIDAEDWALVRLETEGGVPVVLELDFVARRKTRGCEIVGTEGSLIWQSTGRAPEIARVWIARRDGEEDILTALEGPDEYAGMLAAVLDAVLPAGMKRLLPVTQDAPALQTIEEAHRTLALALAARRGYP
jgi:predicted dehydrogenase